MFPEDMSRLLDGMPAGINLADNDVAPAYKRINNRTIFVAGVSDNRAFWYG
jgi:hypothetical protein